MPRFITLSVALLSLGWVVTGCSTLPDGVGSGEQPEILAFVSSASEVYSGSEVVLTWSTLRAEELILESDTGESVDVPRTEVGSGSSTVTVPGDSTWTLRAISPVGEAQATVSIATTPPPIIEFFSATPSMPGLPEEEVVLSWSIIGADSMQVTADDGSVVNSAIDLVGSASVFPRHRLSYTLIAVGALGEVRQTLAVAVQPTIDTILETPNPAPVGSLVTLMWWTSGADEVEITGPRGLLYQAPVRDVGAGRMTLTAQESGELIVSARSGSQETTASVLLELVSPRIFSFVANSATVPTGGTTRLSYEVEGGTTLELRDDTGAVLVEGDTSGRRFSGGLEVSLTRPTTYTLTIENPAGDNVTASVAVGISG